MHDVKFTAPSSTTNADDHSNNDSSDSSDNDDGSRIEWLATSRAKRSTAGNRMRSMLANEDPDSDLELLFAEDDNDAGFTDEGGDAAAGSDAHMDSSSSDEDGGNDELEGEKELEKQAQEKRAAARKRKVQNAIPAKFRKKVRIDTSSTTTASRSESASATTPTTATAAAALDSRPTPRPRKKSERTSWLPSPAEMPTRASQRSATRLGKEQLHQQMVEREARRLRQLEIMQKKAERAEAMRKPPMTQAERLLEAAAVEKRNSKSLNRWEEAEKIREEERRAKLAALNNRTLRGPVLTFWSGMGDWGDGRAGYGVHVAMDDKPKRKRPTAGDKNKAKEQQDDALLKTETPNTNDTIADSFTLPSLREPPPRLMAPPPIPFTTPPPVSVLPLTNETKPAPPRLMAPPVDSRQPTGGVLARPPTMPLLARPEVHQATSHPPLASQIHGTNNNSMLSALPITSLPTLVPLPEKQPPEFPVAIPQETPSTPLPEPTTANPSMRYAIIMQNFDENAIRDKTVQTEILFGRKMARLTKPSPPALCVITHQPARYRDPVTGLAYRNAQAYKEIQRLHQGQYQFSGLLGAWVGSGAVAARGVPARFLGGNHEARGAGQDILKETETTATAG